MSSYGWKREHRPLRGLYRDRENGWIFGVCAGIAEFAGFNAAMVRIIAVVSLCFFTWATAIAYIAATVLIRERPLIFAGRYDEHEFWRGRRYDDGGSRP